MVSRSRALACATSASAVNFDPPFCHLFVTVERKSIASKIYRHFINASPNVIIFVLALLQQNMSVNRGSKCFEKSYEKIKMNARRSGRSTVRFILNVEFADALIYAPYTLIRAEKLHPTDDRAGKGRGKKCLARRF